MAIHWAHTSISRQICTRWNWCRGISLFSGVFHGDPMAISSSASTSHEVQDEVHQYPVMKEAISLDNSRWDSAKHSSTNQSRSFQLDPQERLENAKKFIESFLIESGGKLPTGYKVMKEVGGSVVRWKELLRMYHPFLQSTVQDARCHTFSVENFEETDPEIAALDLPLQKPTIPSLFPPEPETQTSSLELESENKDAQLQENGKGEEFKGDNEKIVHDISNWHAVYLNGLWHGLNARELVSMFQDCGHVLGSKVCLGKGNAAPFGFVYFEKAEEVTAAIQKVDRLKYFNGHRVFADVALSLPSSTYGMYLPSMGEKEDKNEKPALSQSEQDVRLAVVIMDVIEGHQQEVLDVLRLKFGTISHVQKEGRKGNLVVFFQEYSSKRRAMDAKTVWLPNRGYSVNLRSAKPFLPEILRLTRIPSKVTMKDISAECSKIASVKCIVQRQTSVVDVEFYSWPSDEAIERLKVHPYGWNCARVVVAKLGEPATESLRHESSQRFVKRVIDGKLNQVKHLIEALNTEIADTKTFLDLLQN